MITIEDENQNHTYRVKSKIKHTIHGYMKNCRRENIRKLPVGIEAGGED